MKPEHFKKFNVEHAQAGAPYCQRNGLSARIGIWDADHPHYKLLGAATSFPAGESACTWRTNGLRATEANNSSDLVMLPLGFCEGKPVFVGDELNSAHGEVVACYWWTAKDAEGCTWPRKKPVVPSSAGFNCYESERQIANAAFIYAVTECRAEIELYYSELDKFNGVAK